jgi:transcriptional regulator with XRE-family HTH domain
LQEYEKLPAALEAARWRLSRNSIAGCGVTGFHISQIEKGKRSMSTKDLKKLADVLRADVELLL